MKLLNFVICICLVAYAVADDSTGCATVPSEAPEVSSSGGSATPNDDLTTIIEKSSTPVIPSGSSTASARDADSPPTVPSETPEVSSSGGSATPNEGLTTIIDFSDTPTEINVSDGSTTGNENASSPASINTDNDTVIIYSTTLRDENATDEIVISTIIDDDSTVTNTPTAVEDDISENNKSACFGNPCKNGGTCKEELSLPPFSCECAVGYVGIRCETTDKCVYDEDGQPCRHGSCLYSEDGLERFCDCFVKHYWDNVTNECREIKSVCDTNPCENGGMCNLLPGNKYNCSCEMGFSGEACEITDWCVADEDCGHGRCDLSGDKRTRSCKCDDGFYVQEQPHTCKAITTPCDSNPCLNGGVCNSFEDKTHNCTCEKGFSGKACEITDWCVTNEDCGHGVCTLSEKKKIRSCKCSDGFYVEKQPHTCRKISNICQPNPCMHDGICSVLSTTEYNCTCSDGYTGKKCGIRDMCVMDGGNAYCRNSTCETNYDLGIFYCTCSVSEYFQYAERKCVELDLCPLVQCGPAEKCFLGKCDCKDNYKRNNDTRKCEPDFCSKEPCPIPDMICEEGTGQTDYKCSCQEGYTFNGTHCNDALCIFPHLNPCQQNCTVTEMGYECRCDEDFSLNDDNKTCELIGNNTCIHKVCDKGSCVLKSGEEVCICPPGYTEVDENCTDICSAAQIAPGICPSNECEVIEGGGFRCKCEGKFAFSKDKTTCEVRNMCQENEIGWKKCKERNAECVQNWNITEGFKCQCSSGQDETADGTCRDVCSIEINQWLCSMKDATCDVDRKGNRICKCPPYFQASEEDGKCNKPPDVSYLITLPLDRSTYALGNRMRRSLDTSVDYEKISRDVKITIEEMFVGFKRSNLLYCNTTSGYILCKIELQFETEYETQLQRLSTEDICITKENARKKCLVPPALILVKERISEDVIIVPTDPCEESIKEENCGSETSCTSSIHTSNFNCSCKPGFAMRKRRYPFADDHSVVESCNDINECMDDPCPPNSNCKNTLGSYACECMRGFRSVDDPPGSKELKCVEICHPNPCTHGLCSRRRDHDFDCKCDAGYRGAFCDLQDENFKRARANSIIVGVVLGGILLITCILFAVYISRLRRTKSFENPGQMVYNTIEMSERGRINNAFQRE